MAPLRVCPTLGQKRYLHLESVELPVPHMSTKSSMSQITLPAPQPERPSVSVVIVVWNAKKYVLECLESLREHCRDVYDEVIIVDNASTDGTPAVVADRFPEFKLICNSENLGFAKANNIGIQQAVGDF